jgi:hypothetical protein
MSRKSCNAEIRVEFAIAGDDGHDQLCCSQKYVCTFYTFFTDKSYYSVFL